MFLYVLVLWNEAQYLDSPYLMMDGSLFSISYLIVFNQRKVVVEDVTNLSIFINNIATFHLIRLCSDSVC